MMITIKELGRDAQAPFNHQIFHYIQFLSPQRLLSLWFINITPGKNSLPEICTYK